jgi:hypothetical protein
MQKWEYLVAPVTFDDAALNELGAQGWELVAINHFNGSYLNYIFKRPKI